MGWKRKTSDTLDIRQMKVVPMENIGSKTNSNYKVSCAIRTACDLTMLGIYVVVSLLLLLTTPSSVASHDPWGENLQPKLHTDYLNRYSGKDNRSRHNVIDYVCVVSVTLIKCEYIAFYNLIV